MKKRDLSKEKKCSDDEGDSLILIKELKNLNLAKQTGSVETIKNSKKETELRCVKQQSQTL
jgi:hypothetical protein